MKEKLCKNCLHWTDSDSDYANPYDWETGEKMKFEFEVKQCKHPKLLFCERPLENNTFAVADGSQYMAALYTAGNFGCVLYERIHDDK